MKRLWVIEAQFTSGTWGICSFAGMEYVDTNFYTAHKLKRKLQIYLQKHGCKHWQKNRFRVKEYIAN